MTLSRYQCRQWMHSSVIQTCTRSSLSKNTSYDIYIYIYIHKNHAYAIRAGKASINRSSSYDNAYCEKCVSCCIFVCVCSVISGDLASIVVLCITHTCSVHGASNSGRFKHVRRI